MDNGHKIKTAKNKQRDTSVLNKALKRSYKMLKRNLNPMPLIEHTVDKAKEVVSDFKKHGFPPISVKKKEKPMTSPRLSKK